MTATHSLRHFAYCGLSLHLLEGTAEECRQRASRWLSARRRDGFPVATLDKGERWEIQEPGFHHALIPTECGILVIERIPSPYGECRECGSSDDWHEDGRNNVLCGCQACPDCGIIDAYGFHEPGCVQLEEAEW